MPAPPPPRREVRNEPKPATAFRIPVGTLPLRYSGSAAVGDLDPDNPSPILTRNRDHLAGNTAQVPVMCSGRTGTWFSASPVAARIAATMAGPEEIVGGSPTPRKP